MSNVRNFIIDFACRWGQIAREAIITGDQEHATARRFDMLDQLDKDLEAMAVPTPEPVNVDVLTREATTIAKYLHRELYSGVKQWQPLDSLPGLMSQIDNMVCGIPDLKRKYEDDLRAMEQRLLQGHDAIDQLLEMQQEPLTNEMVKQMKERCDTMEMRGAFVDGWLSAEAAHGIGEKK